MHALVGDRAPHDAVADEDYELVGSDNRHNNGGAYGGENGATTHTSKGPDASGLGGLLRTPHVKMILFLISITQVRIKLYRS